MKATRQIELLSKLSREGLISRRDFMGLVAGTAALTGGAALLDACGLGGSSVPTESGSLKIGVSEALTGSLASSFKALYAPLLVAVEEINGAGGILGRKINLDVQDDQGLPANEPTVGRNLLANGDTVVMGPVGSSQALAMAQVLKGQNVLFGPLADLDALGDPTQYPFSFRISRSTSARVALGADWALTKTKKIGILYENTAFGQAGAPLATSRLQASGVQPVLVDSFQQLAASLTPYALKQQQAGAEAVLLFASATGDNLHLLESMVAANYTPFIAVTSAAVLDQISTSAELAPFKDKVAIGQFVNLVYSPGKPLAARQQKYAKAVAAKLSATDPKTDVLAGPFYDFLYILKNAIETTKSFDYTTVASQMEHTTNFDGMVCRITFTPALHSAVTPVNAHDVMVMATQTDPSAPESLGFILKKA